MDSSRNEYGLYYKEIDGEGNRNIPSKLVKNTPISSSFVSPFTEGVGSSISSGLSLNICSSSARCLEYVSFYGRKNIDRI